MPIRKGDGTELSPKNYAEIRKGDGTVLYPPGVSRWEFEQDVTDFWGSNDGTQNGGTFTTDAQVGSYALSLDGTDDYVNVPYNASLDGSPLSVSCWIKADDPSNTENFYDHEESGKGWWLRTGNGNVEFYIGDGSNQGPASYGISSGTWYHVVGTHDGSTGRLYVDGTERDSFTSGSISTHTLDIAIGRAEVFDGRYFPGIVDDPRFYDKALSSTEVSNLYSTDSI